MSRRQQNGAEAPGQDSFLDVVANLVGVLIILVMVVGTQAKNTKGKVPASAAPVDTSVAPDLATARQQVAVIQQEIVDLREKASREEFEVSYRRQERDKLQLMVTAAQLELEKAKQQLSGGDRQNLEVSTRIEASFAQLAELDEAIAGIKSTEKPTEVLQHYPTPMAKTVFGKELHFRLQDGRVTFVPFEEFVARLKVDAPKQMWKLKDVEQITESLGPLQGFRMKYSLKREIVSVPVSGGIAKGERAVLEHFVLIPTSDELGEPVDQALQPNSEMHSILKQHHPKQYTITLWVYPESFQHFRQVRNTLLKQGFICAGRPMPAGHPIGGSPEGSRSAAQ
jgi:hypothetical protein